MREVAQKALDAGETKTRIVREVAQKALDAGEIQQDIFNALVSRKF